MTIIKKLFIMEILKILKKKEWEERNVLNIFMKENLKMI